MISKWFCEGNKRERKNTNQKGISEDPRKERVWKKEEVNRLNTVDTN